MGFLPNSALLKTTEDATKCLWPQPSTQPPLPSGHLHLLRGPGKEGAFIRNRDRELVQERGWGLRALAGAHQCLWASRYHCHQSSRPLTAPHLALCQAQHPALYVHYIISATTWYDKQEGRHFTSEDIRLSDLSKVTQPKSRSLGPGPGIEGASLPCHLSLSSHYQTPHYLLSKPTPPATSLRVSKPQLPRDQEP